MGRQAWLPVRAGLTIIMVTGLVPSAGLRSCIRTPLVRICQAHDPEGDEAAPSESQRSSGIARAREGVISRVGRARGENAGEAADGSGAERRGAEGGSGSVERTKLGAAGGPGPEGRARPVEEQAQPVRRWTTA